jgi:type IV pilus assembly protein PilM
MIISTDTNFFGLDISDGAIRLVRLIKKGKKIWLISHNEIELPAGVIVNGEIKNEDKLVEGLRLLLKTVRGAKISDRNAITVLPESKTFIKVIQLGEANNDEEMLKLIKEEIKNHIPLSFEEIYLDWQVVKQKPGSTSVLISAAPRDLVNAYYAALEKSGINPYVLGIEAAAITRCLIAKDDNRPKMVIDFGASRTGLILYENQVPQLTVSLPISGNNITQAISQTLKIELKEAEKAKVICGLNQDKCEGALLKILLSTMDNLTKQIKKSMIFYQDSYPGGEPISEIILCGGGANFSMIDKVLAEKLKLPVRTGDPLLNVTLGNKISISKNKLLSYTTAIGLALRPVFKKEFATTFTLNLIPPEKKKDLELTQLFFIIRNIIGIIFIVTSFSAIILLTSKIVLNDVFIKTVEQTTLTTKYAKLFNHEIKNFNIKVQTVEMIENDYIPWKDFLIDFTKLIPRQTILDSAEIYKDRILIAGQAPTRADLLELKANFEKSPYFSEVNVPLENLLKRENIRFTIKAKLNLKQIK